MSAVPKLVTDTAARLLFTSATVGTIVGHEGFRTIELVGDRLSGTEWVPGDKIRIHVDGMTLRTYTPLSWDRDRGATTVLAYLPGDGPGANWCATARTGEACSFLGPKRSVRLDRFAAPPIIVGDETSFGLFLAWRGLERADSPAAAVFEVTSARVASSALAAHGADEASVVLVEREPDDAHLPALADHVVTAVRRIAEAPISLTGRAQTIASLRKRLKAEDLARRDTEVKAYWDQNRKGLD
jgi:NADPH-dependent ferric siderophore reductase